MMHHLAQVPLVEHLATVRAFHKIIGLPVDPLTFYPLRHVGEAVPRHILFLLFHRFPPLPRCDNLPGWPSWLP